MSTFLARTASRTSSLVGFCFRLVFGSLAVLIGVAIIVWVGYNWLIERQPQFSGSRIFPSLGIAPVTVAVGIYWLRGLRRNRQRAETDDA